MNSTTSEERSIALTRLFHQHAFAHGRGDEFAEACAIDVAEVLGATAWDVHPTRGAVGSLVGEGWVVDLAPLCAQLRESTVGQIGAITRGYLVHALTQAGFARTWVRPVSPDDREALGKVVHQAASAYGVALGRGPSDPWHLTDPVDREGARRVGVAVATSVGITSGAAKPEGVRYRRVSLYGHVSLGVCRVEDIEVAGVKMLRTTTLCDATPRVEEFPGTSVYSLGVLSPEEAMDAAQKAATARAEQARRDAEYAARDAREQEARRVARASALATVTVVGANVELRVFVGPTRRPDLLRRDDAEVSQALRAAVSDLHNTILLYDEGYTVGLEVVHEADRVEDLDAMLRELGFGNVTRLPDQPARAEDDDIPFDDAAAVAHYDEPSDGSEPGGGA